jgi:pilus assembly protein FimV
LAESSDIELDELEALPEAEEAGEEKEIEIDFEDQESATGEKKESTENSVPLEEVMEFEEVPDIETPLEAGPQKTNAVDIPEDLKDEIRTVLKYMDQLLEALPEEKIQEFASSEYFVMYKKLFEDLGLGE